MSFLNVIPYTLFRVLAAPAHARYVSVLERIFGEFFDDFAFAPKRTEVLSVIRQVLDDVGFNEDAEAEQVEYSNGNADSWIYSRLREDGWIMEVQNRRTIEVYMPRDAHALLSALITLKEELRVDISAEASLIDSGLLAAYDDPAGKVMNIGSARRQAVQLRRSIDGVVTSLHRIEEELVHSDGLADLLAKFMERFVEKLLLENYRALKTSAYNPMRFQRSILASTERFIGDDEHLSRAATALAEQHLAPNPEVAQTQILQDLNRIRDVFSGMSDKLDLIDRFSHKLERRIATTVRYQESARNVRGEQIRDAIKLLSSRLESGRLDCVSPLMQWGMPYSTATLAVPKRAREPVEPRLRRQKLIDPADVLREKMMNDYAAAMDVTAATISERLSELVEEDTFFDLDKFEPVNARDVAILYEARVRAEQIPGFEVRRPVGSIATNEFVSGPRVLLRKKRAS